ncbi:MAG: DUF1127 domain-containing protein [Paracoccaceae bacterium]
MTMMTDTGAQRGAFFAAPLTWVASLGDRFSRYRMYRKTLDELTALSARELDDLGLNRSMLKRVALEAAYGA